MARKAGSPVSALGIGTKVAEHDIEIKQAVDQALADTTKPSAEQARAEGSTPAIGLDRDLKLREPSEDDSGRSDEPGLILGDVLTSSASLRAGLTDLTASAGSTEEDPLETFLGTGRPSRDELESTLPAHMGGGSEEASQEDMRDAHNQARSGIMLSQWSYDYTDNKGHEHEKEIAVDPDFYFERDTDKTTGDTTTQYEVPGSGWVIERTDAQTGMTVRLDSYGDWTVKDKDGNVTYKGKDMPVDQVDAVISDSEEDTSSGGSEENSDTDQKEDDKGEENSGGSFWDAIVDFVTGLFGGKDEDTSQTESETNGGGVETTADPDYIPPEVRKEMIEAAGLDKIYRGSHDQDEIQLVEESATGWTATDGETAGAIPDLQDVLLGGDRRGDEPLHQGGGASVGDAMDRTSQNGGATDWGPEHADAQGSGPEERDLGHEVKPKADDKSDAKAGAGDKGDASEESSSESAVELVAVQDPKTETLREHVEKDGGPKQDTAIDPDKVEKVHAREGAPSKGSADDLVVQSEKPFEFRQEVATSRDLELQLSAHIDLGGDVDEDTEVAEFSAPAVMFEHHHMMAQSAFDLDAA